MATKSKRRPKRISATGRFQQAQREFDKGNFKRALKDAKICFRQDPSGQHCQLLQRACLARARQLQQSGMRSECRAVLETLLDLGVSEPSVEKELPELLAAVGLLDRNPAAANGASIEADARLLTSVADHAVLRPGEAPSSMPQIRRGAASIRSALSALDADDRSRLVGSLKDIARNSPFADWKYFVRGLTAYYRQDLAETRANWDRLDPQRVAARIAAPLAVLADPASADRTDQRVRGALGKLETEVLGGQVLTCLHEVRDHVAAGRWNNALKSLGKSPQMLRRLDPDVSQRIVLILYHGIVHKGLKSALGELARIADPPPMDPRWNRARAMMWEHPDNREIKKGESHWLRYLADLDDVPCLSPPERKTAQALVWQRIGVMYVDECDTMPKFFRAFDGGDGREELRARAVDCFANSLKLDPKILPTYVALATAQESWDQPEEEAETYRQAIEHFPEDVEALLHLALHHHERDEPLPARDYLLRARRLKPLDKKIIDAMWMVHVASARHYALQKQWEKGRAELEAAEKLKPQNPEAYALTVRKAILELKAGNLGVGQQLLDRAKAEIEEPAPVLLVATVEATRYAMSGQFIADFQHQWTTALRKKCSSRTAGKMCGTLTAHMVANGDYAGRAAHVEHLLGYIRRCSRVKWQSDDLRGVCLFLMAVCSEAESSREKSLLTKLVRKGHKKFPECAFFHYVIGEMEMAKGPAACDRQRAIRCFETTLELARDSTDPQDAEFVGGAKRNLALLANSEQDYDDDYDDDCDPDEDYDDDYEDSPFAGPPLDEFFDGTGFSFADIPRDEMFTQFLKMCASLGMDPEEVLSRAAAGTPPIGPRPKRRSRNKRRKKR